MKKSIVLFSLDSCKESSSLETVQSQKIPIDFFSKEFDYLPSSTTNQIATYRKLNP